MSNTINLDHLIVEAQQTLVADYEAEQERKRLEAKATTQRVTGAFKMRLEAALGEELAQALDIAYAIFEQTARAQFTYGGVQWTLKLHGENSFIAHHDNTPGKMAFLADPSELKVRLLAAIGHERIAHQNAEQEAAERQRQRDADRERDAARQKAEEIERQAQAASDLALHTQLVARVQAVVDAAIAGRWTWPEGVSITVYHLRWTTGVVNGDEDAGANIAFDDGWTTTDQLDEQGYIALQAQRWAKARTIKLAPTFHKPIWERVVWSELADLPSDFLDSRTNNIPIQGIAQSYSAAAQRHLFVDDPDNTWWETLNVASLPLDWVRDLVDRAAAAQPPAPGTQERA